MSIFNLHVFFTMTNGNKDYQKFMLMFSAGKQNGGPGHVGTIASPEPVENVTIPPTLPNPVFFSYPFSVAEKGFVRGLLAKIVSEGGVIPSSCTFQLLSVPEPAADEWKPLSAGDITLKYGGDPNAPSTWLDILTNPQDIACIGEIIIGIDYDSVLLAIIGVSELVGKSGAYRLQTTPYDMSTLLGGDAANARGRAIIAFGGNAYPLFINYVEVEAGVWQHLSGIITRVGISGSVLSDGARAYVGKNPQEVVPGISGSGETFNFVPAIGGEQLTDDGDTIATNGTDSNICVLPAGGTWPEYAPILLTGDSDVNVALVTAYDIHDLGVICRNGASLVFIMTAMYGGPDYNRLYYRIYLGTVDGLLSLLNYTPPESKDSDNPPVRVIPTLSQAVEAGVLTVIDEGGMESDPAEPAGLYHPSINIVQHPTDPEKDLVVVCTGSTILITRALAYGSPTAKDPPVPPEPASGADPAPEPPYSRNNPYTLFGNAGGPSMNCLDITIETLYQAMRGVSLKRGARMSRATGGAAAKAATSAAKLGTKGAAAGEKEEE